MSETKKWTLSWLEAVAAGPGICGGKGYNLGRLNRYGFSVPQGGVFIADGYREFIESVSRSEQARDLLKALSGITAAEATSDDAMRQLKHFRQAICCSQLPSKMSEDIASFLTDTGLIDKPLAVRSSATAEDSPEASFAGLHRSVLNVRGVEAVLESIKACAASLWTPQAVAYRRHQGFSDHEVACAVVLCQMLAPEAAGVAFSCDPRSGRRDCVVINAARGLGDALVSGQVTPEQITIVLRDGRLIIIERERSGEHILSDNQALQLARLVLRVHWALGDGQSPQDVEWALADARFWLVQGRPVTRVPHVTAPDIANMPVIWSNANLAEVLPGVPTTMTWSIMQGTLRDSLYAGPAVTGYSVPRTDVCRRFWGRLYFDLTAMQWVSYDAFGLLPADCNRVVGGHQPEIPVPPRSLYSEVGRVWRNLRFMLALRRVAKTFPDEMNALRRATDEWNAIDLSSLTFEQMHEHLEESVAKTATFFHRFILASMTALYWLTLLEQALRRIAPQRGSTLASLLMAGTGKVVTAEMGYRLIELARIAASEPAAAEYLRQEPLDPHGWHQLPATSTFRQAIQELLDEFGHRAVYEHEMANPRWREDPSYLLEQTRMILDGGDFRSREEVAMAKQAGAAAEVARLTRLCRPLIHWLARRARHGSALREAGRSTVGAARTFARAVALEVADRLVKAGRLSQREDVFHLSCWDLVSLLRGEWNGSGARALVADRKALAAGWLATEPPKFFVLDAQGKPTALPPEFQKIAPSSSATPGACEAASLVGIAASSGQATGPCRVVRHPEDGRSLRSGEILVARSTDPSWTPLFLRATGIATEIGGYLSHAAIVAREYGLPAVLNIPGLLDVVHDGQQLTVDGDAGRVICNLQDRT